MGNDCKEIMKYSPTFAEDPLFFIYPTYSDEERITNVKEFQGLLWERDNLPYWRGRIMHTWPGDQDISKGKMNRELQNLVYGIYKMENRYPRSAFSRGGQTLFIDYNINPNPKSPGVLSQEELKELFSLRKKFGFPEKMEPTPAEGHTRFRNSKSKYLVCDLPPLLSVEEMKRIEEQRKRNREY